MYMFVPSSSFPPIFTKNQMNNNILQIRKCSPLKVAFVSIIIMNGICLYTVVSIKYRPNIMYNESGYIRPN